MCVVLSPNIKTQKWFYFITNSLHSTKTENWSKHTTMCTCLVSYASLGAKWQLAVYAGGHTAAAWLVWVDVSLSVVHAATPPTLPPPSTPFLLCSCGIITLPTAKGSLPQVTWWGWDRHNHMVMSVREREEGEEEWSFGQMTEQRIWDSMSTFNTHKNRLLINPSHSWR